MALLMIGLFAAMPARADLGETLEIPISVEPHTLQLGSVGTWVTVHAQIPASIVVGMTVQLNGVEVVYTKADNRGELVAKFALDSIKSIVAPPDALLTLTGVCRDGTAFTGSAVVPVIQATPAKQ
jgi:hypothetical protein